MTEVNIFEVAARKGIRFDTSLGLLTVEDLWNLKLLKGNVTLDKIAIQLRKEIQDTSNESFVAQKSSVDEITDLKFQIVKHIITVKMAENAEASSANEVKEHNQKIMDIIARKSDAAMEDMSVEELQAALK